VSPAPLRFPVARRLGIVRRLWRRSLLSRRSCAARPGCRAGRLSLRAVGSRELLRSSRWAGTGVGLGEKYGQLSQMLAPRSRSGSNAGLPSSSQRRRIFHHPIRAVPAHGGRRPGHRRPSRVHHGRHRRSAWTPTWGAWPAPCPSVPPAWRCRLWRASRYSCPWKDSLWIDGARGPSAALCCALVAPGAMHGPDGTWGPTGC